MMQIWRGARIASSAPSPTWDADIDIALLPHRHRPPHMMTTPMITIRPQAPTQGMEIIIALVDHTLVMMILAQTQGAESSIAMLVLMSVLNKIHQGVTSGTILAMTKGAEDNHNMIKMRGPSVGGKTPGRAMDAERPA